MMWRSEVKASDIMTSQIVTIGPTASVRDVAALLLSSHISAVPVVDEKGGLLGIVSESDLMRRVETATERRSTWWLELFSSNEALAAEFVKMHARKVSDVMTPNVVTADPETPISEIASILEKNRIKRVPIIENGKVVGIVSRANLLQALASVPQETGARGKANDATIRDQVEAQLNKNAWTKPWHLNVIVHDGIVELWGVVHSQIEKTAARVSAEEVPGVCSVNDNLVVWSDVAGST
jgi:CBS domain-containing protein